MRRSHVLKIAMRGALAIVFLGFAICPSLAAEKKEIRVKSSVVSGKGVLVVGEIEGKPLQMACGLSLPDCVALKPGKYLMVKPADKDIYTDCSNVDIYRRSTTKNARDEKVGVFCLGDEDPDSGRLMRVPLN